MKTRSRFLTLAAATVAAVAALSGCSAQETPESVALSFSQAFMTNNGKLPSEFMCEGAPKDEADGARWTTDLATEVKTGAKGEVDSDGYQVVETVYDRSSQDDYTMGIKVDTRNLCVTDAGSHLTVKDSASEESSPTPTETHEPVEVVFEGDTIKWSEIAAVLDDGDIPVIMLPAVVGGSVTLVGSNEINSFGHENSMLTSRDTNDDLVIAPLVETSNLKTTYGEVIGAGGELYSGDEYDGDPFLIQVRALKE